MVHDNEPSQVVIHVTETNIRLSHYFQHCETLFDRHESNGSSFSRWLLGEDLVLCCRFDSKCLTWTSFGQGSSGLETAWSDKWFSCDTSGDETDEMLGIRLWNSCAKFCACQLEPDTGRGRLGIRSYLMTKSSWGAIYRKETTFARFHF